MSCTGSTLQSQQLLAVCLNFFTSAKFLYISLSSKSEKIFNNFLIKAIILNDMRKYLYNRIWLSLFFVMFCRTTEVSKISKNNISKRKHLVYMNCNSVF